MILEMEKINIKILSNQMRTAREKKNSEDDTKVWGLGTERLLTSH